MKYIQGKNRSQLALIPTSLEDAIDSDNEVRLIDLFVDSLDFAQLGFKIDHVDNGRPAYHPSDLLKLFLYGYLNRIRSSRALEKECKRNIELMWLLKSLAPDHNTISNFRKDNPKAIREVFRQTVRLARDFELIGGRLVAGDSTKLRAQNAKKKNFNQKKIDRHLKFIDQKLDQYTTALEEADGDNKKVIKEQINKYKKRKDDFDKMSKELNDSGQTQISTSDPDSRNVIIRNRITEVCYSAQTTVDAKHNIPIDYKVTNENDFNAMGEMLGRSVGILGHNNFTALYDKGYHNGKELKKAEELGVNAIVSVPELASASRAPDERYNVQHFHYDPKEDHYTCPEGQTLTSNQSWYTSTNSRARFKQYKTKVCKSCPAKHKCTKAKNGKLISRSEHQQYYQNNRERWDQNRELYRRRQAIVEHPYGTIKRYWGFDHVITKKGIERASTDIGMIFTAYNLRRIFNLVGKNELKRYLKEMFLLFLTGIRPIAYKIRLLNEIKIGSSNHVFENRKSLQRPLSGFRIFSF
jgi:transposase